MAHILFSLNLLAEWIIFVGLLGVVLATDCPNTWTAYDESCYLFGTETHLKFVEAEHFCRQHNGHLVHVDNANEAAFLKHYINSFRPSDYWLGLTDERIEGVWMWYDTDTSPTFTDWIPGQPDDYKTNEDCAVFYSATHFTWNDVPCESLYEPICEIRYFMSCGQHQ